MDENECPICFDPMTPSVTKVYLGCCRQEIRLSCYKRCGFKCPFCRTVDQELMEVRVTQEPQEERLIQPPIVSASSVTRENLMFYQRLSAIVIIISLMVVSFLLFIISSGQLC